MHFPKRGQMMMAAGLSLAGLAMVLGYKSWHGVPEAPTVAVRPAPAVSTTALAMASAVRDIAVGETVTGSLVRTVVGDVNRNPTVATPAEAIGKVATHAIPAGALIQRTMIDDRTRLAIRVPVGMRAMSIETTAEIAVAGLIRPGDDVDVQVVYPGQDSITGARGEGRSHGKALLQVVPVLAVGDLVLGTNAGKTGNAASDSPAASAARTVTLALTPDQVSILSLAKHVGTLSLSLRNPEDKAMDAPAPSVSDRPQASTPRHRLPHRAVREPSGSAVQIVVGSHSDMVR